MSGQKVPGGVVHELPADLRAVKTMTALERWLDAIHVARTHRGA